jgi:hypothetical protein
MHARKQFLDADLSERGAPDRGRRALYQAAAPGLPRGKPWLITVLRLSGSANRTRSLLAKFPARWENTGNFPRVSSNGGKEVTASLIKAALQRPFAFPASGIISARKFSDR